MKELSVPNYVSTYRNLFYTLHESALISYLSLQTLGQKALVQGRALRCSDVLSLKSSKTESGLPQRRDYADYSDMLKKKKKKTQVIHTQLRKFSSSTLQVFHISVNETTTHLENGHRLIPHSSFLPKSQDLVFLFLKQIFKNLHRYHCNSSYPHLSYNL